MQRKRHPSFMQRWMLWPTGQPPGLSAGRGCCRTVVLLASDSLSPQEAAQAAAAEVKQVRDPLFGHKSLSM